MPTIEQLDILMESDVEFGTRSGKDAYGVRGSYSVEHNTPWGGTPDGIASDGSMIDLKTVTVQVESRVRTTRWKMTMGQPIVCYSGSMYRIIGTIVKTANLVHRLKRKYEKVNNSTYLNNFDRFGFLRGLRK